MSNLFLALNSIVVAQVCLLYVGDLPYIGAISSSYDQYKIDRTPLAAKYIQNSFIS